MNGYQIIDPDLLRDIRIQIRIVKAAIVEKPPIASKLSFLLQEGNVEQAAANPNMAAFLETISQIDSELDLAVELYNEFIQTENLVERRKNLLNAAVSKFQVRKPIDVLTRLIQSPTTNVHINIIGTQRNIRRGFRKK